MTIGRYLVQERELRGMSLGEVVAHTKIPRPTLEALEEDADDRLPERVYVVGYLRAYADALGLDPDDVVLRYEEETGPLEERERSARPEPPGARRRWVLPALALALVAAAVGLALVLLVD